MNIEITLVCFNCGHKHNIVINREPRFAFELVEIANEAGMLGVFDLAHGRSLVFCNHECADNQKTKNGSFRVRPKK